ncbi:hypothetical protein Tco_0833187 [Tanacetum coccineum]
MDQSKFKFKFVLDTKELTMTVADFIRIFRFPQATDDNHDEFVDAPTFSQMVPFYRNALGFSLTLRSPLNFVSKGLPQLWQTLCKIFARCLTTRVTGHDQPPGTHRTTSAHRIPNLEVTKGESSAQCKPTVIRFRVPPRRQDPETPIPTSVEIDITNLDETIQMSIAIQRSIEDYEAQHNVAKVKEHIVDEELDQLLKGAENVDVDAFIDDFLNSQEDPDARIKPRSDKESPKAEKDVDMVTIHNEEVEEGSAGDEFELRRREKGKDKEKLQELMVIDPPHSSSLPNLKTGRKKFHQLAKHLHSTMEEFLPLMTQADVAAMIAESVQKEHENLRAEITLQVNNVIANSFPSHVDSFLRNYMANNILHVHLTQAPTSSA